MSVCPRRALGDSAHGDLRVNPSPDDLLRFLQEMDLQCEYHGDSLSHAPGAPDVLSGEFSDRWCGCERWQEAVSFVNQWKQDRAS